MCHAWMQSKGYGILMQTTAGQFTTKAILWLFSETLYESV